MRDSHFNFHRKIAMLLILIYIFFIFSSSFRFFICDYVIPVSPVTPSLNSSSEKGLKFELWLRDSQFNFHNKIAIYFDLYLLFLCFSFVTTWSPCPPWPPIKSSPEKRVWYLSCDCVIPISISTRKLPCYLYWFMYSLCFFLFLDFHLWLMWVHPIIFE